MLVLRAPYSRLLAPFAYPLRLKPPNGVPAKPALACRLEHPPSLAPSSISRLRRGQSGRISWRRRNQRDSDPRVVRDFPSSARQLHLRGDGRMQARQGRVTERTFYPVLTQTIERLGGSGVQEINFNSEPDIVFDLRDRRWLLSVKIDEAPAIMRRAFIQYQRHKDESRLQHGLILFLPVAARRTAANAEALRHAVENLPVTAIVDTPGFKDEYSGLTFPQTIRRLMDEVVPRLRRQEERPYSLGLVVKLLREHVREMMGAVDLSDPLLLRVVTSRDLLSEIGDLTERQVEAAGRFLASYIVLSQILFLRLLGTAIPWVLPADLVPVTHHSLREAFRRVLDVNYRPIYDVDVLDAISVSYLEETFRLIWGLEVERARHELPGRIFHELMPPTIRKMLAAFYTRPLAADLLAHLTLRSHGATVLDPACGSGTILTSAYKRKRELFQEERRVGNPHERFVEEEIFGADLMPFAVHLTSANLAAMDPGTVITRNQIIRGDSLRLAAGGEYRYGLQFGMFPAAARAETTSGEAYEVTLNPVEAVLMNPPFTKVERRIQDYVDMRRFRKLLGGEVGLWGHFVALADEFLAEGGTVGAVLPINLLRGRESAKVRDLVFSRWTPLYVLKATMNYGFSEYAEYRDILFIAVKGQPDAGHRVKFGLIKKDLTQLDQDDVHHIAQRVQALGQESSEDLDIRTFTIAELRERFVNLMWFCGVSDYGHKDVLTSFVERFREHLDRFPDDYFREGYRPVPKGVSSFLFLTRNLEPSRIEEAFLSFDDEDDRGVRARSSRGVTYDIERESLTRTLRTNTGLRTMSVTGRHDYIAHRPYHALRRISAASRFRRPARFEWDGFWREMNSELEEVRTHLVTIHRINPYSPSTSLAAWFSEEPISPSNQLTVIRESDLGRAKAVCCLLNSAVFLAQFFLLKEETTGRYINVRFYDFAEMMLYPDEAAVSRLSDVFEYFADYEFPSLTTQLDEDFEQRYQQFWSLQRRAQPSLFPTLRGRAVRPSQIRTSFDLAVCEALGSQMTERELADVYRVIVEEMIITRGLQSD